MDEEAIDELGKLIEASLVRTMEEMGADVEDLSWYGCEIFMDDAWSEEDLWYWIDEVD